MGEWINMTSQALLSAPFLVLSHAASRQHIFRLTYRGKTWTKELHWSQKHSKSLIYLNTYLTRTSWMAIEWEEGQEMVPHVGSTPLISPVDKIAMDLEMTWTRSSVLFISEHTMSHSGDNSGTHMSNCSYKIYSLQYSLHAKERL